MYGTERARYQIGRVGIITLAEAREAARKFLAQRTLGKRENPTLKFEDALAIFFESQAERIRPNTMRDYKRLLDTHFKPKLKAKPLLKYRPTTSRRSSTNCSRQKPNATTPLP